MKKTIRFLALVLVVAALIGCISAFAKGTQYPCNHSYAESYESGAYAIGRTHNSQGSETQTAKVYGTYKTSSTATAIPFSAARVSGYGVAVSTYTVGVNSTCPKLLNNCKTLKYKDI